jgi:3-oxoadipate enol-lactonase
MTSEQSTIVNGRAVRFFDRGKGRPLLLLHAFPLSAAMWQDQIDRVPDGWRFIAPDFRGFGATPTDPGVALSMDDYARDVLGVMDALAIESAVIGGLSMGGYVTFALFRLAPERFAGVVLADTKAPADSAEARAGRRAMSETVRTAGPRAIVDTLLSRLVGETTCRDRPQVLARVRELMEQTSAAGIDAALHALMTRPDSTPDLGRIRCPALVIVGQEDTLTPQREAELLAGSIAGAELVVVPRVGHLANLEGAQEFSDALAAFLARTF